MSTILPINLPNATSLSATDLFIVQQGTLVLKLHYSTLQAALVTTTHAYVDNVIGSVYGSVLNQITALQTSLNSKAAADHIHTKAEIGLGEVENLAPLDLPLSTALIDALANNVTAPV